VNSLNKEEYIRLKTPFSILNNRYFVMKQLYRITDTFNFGMFSGSDKSIQRLFIGTESITSYEEQCLNIQYKKLMEDMSNAMCEQNLNEFKIPLPDKSEIKAYMAGPGYDQIIRHGLIFIREILAFEKVSQKDYIEWCIEKTEDFCIHPSDLNALYSLETYNHESIIVTNVKQNDGQWSANFKLDEKKETHMLSDKTRDINKLKFDNIYN
jgi:hypothetical protein